MMTPLESNKKIHYIGKHKHVFEVENLYPLNLFENFVERIEETGNCVLESSCKIDQDKLYPVRFGIGFATESPEQFKAVFGFFRQVEARIDVKLDYTLLQQFLGDDFDFGKMTDFMLGVDLRRELSESRLKIGLTIENYPEKQEVAITLNSTPDEAVQALLISNRLHMGFDFRLDGHSEIELYPHIMKQDFQCVDVQQRLAQVLLPPALRPLPACSRICVGFSKANAGKIVYYYLEDLNDFFNYFAVNDVARRAHAYYREQPVREMCVALPEQELLTGTTIQQLNLYYLI
jgi:LynF/TruF/PatF family peptide O-prenyltransferase